MKNNYKEYKILDRQIDALYDERKYDEAINLLEDSYEKFPDYDFELKFYCLICYRGKKNNKKCLDLLLEGLSQGYFYGLHWQMWNPLKDSPKWSEIERTNQINKKIAQNQAKMEYKVFTPEQYKENNNYPLFITLHGDGNACNIEDFTKEWQPTPLLQRGFIVAYVQSSHVECTGGFGWTTDYNQSRKEINDAYMQICDQYSIDKKKVIVGGFSGGSMASLNLMINETFPIKGIVALCPNETDDCTEENIQKVAANNIKMVLLEGEKSGKIEFHYNLMKWAEKYKLPAKYIINKETGHNVPEDFDRMINKAMDFLIK